MLFIAIFHQKRNLNNFLILVVFGQYGSWLKDNIFHQSAEDRLWTGLAAGDTWWVKSAIRGAAISINQHTRVDTTNATTIIIIKVDANTIVSAIPMSPVVQ